MRLFDVLKAGGYNPNRDKNGKFASGGGSKGKAPTPLTMDKQDHEGYMGAERFNTGERPLLARGRARGFGAKTDEVYSDTIGDPNGIEVNIFNTTRDEQYTYHHAGTQGVTDMSINEVRGIMRQFPRNWTPKLLKHHNFVRIN